ncbi:MAG: VCBS repeat-containing protein, partial [Polyangiaceae bacterium]
VSGGLSQPFPIHASSPNPAVGLLAHDGDAGTSESTSDLVFAADDGVTTWRGRSDRKLAPTPYPSLQLGAEESRLVEARSTRPTDDVLLLVPLDLVAPGTPGSALFEIGYDALPNAKSTFVIFPTNDQLPSQVVGEIPVARLIDTPTSPCSQVALAFGSQAYSDRVFVITTCVDADTLNAFDSTAGQTAPPIAPREVELPPGVVTRSGGLGVRTGDVNGDGHLDLVLDAATATLPDGGTDAAPATYVAYGLGDGQFTSDPTTSTVDESFTPLPDKTTTLAVGRVTTDPYPDFVFPSRIVLHVPGSGPVSDAGPSIDEVVINAPQQWGDARIADFDGDGTPDVIAGSNGRVDIYRASGNDIAKLTAAHYAIEGTASDFAVGDYDGDRAPDIAFRADHGDGTADLIVMWGKHLGMPDDPVIVGRFGDIRSIRTGIIESNFGKDDAVSDIGVVLRSPEGVFSVSVLAGATNRQLQAPFFLQKPIVGTTTSVASPLGFAVGQLSIDDRHLDLVAETIIGRDAGTDAGPGEAFDVHLAVAESSGAAQLSSDPSLLKFTDRLDTFQSSASACETPFCDVPAADWTRISLVTVDLDDSEDTVGAVDEVVGIAPAIANGNPAHDAIAHGVFFWAKYDGSSWNIESTVPLGSLPAQARKAIGEVRRADVDGDGLVDVLVLSDGPSGTTLSAYINRGDGRLPTTATPITLPAPSGPPGPGHIISFAPVEADGAPGKELALLTDSGGVYLAKATASGAAFLVTGPLCNGDVIGSCDGSTRASISSGKAIAAVDVDGDGLQDLVVESSLALHVYKGLAVSP